MADRIDISSDSLRLTGAVPAGRAAAASRVMTVRPIAQAPRVVTSDVEMRASAVSRLDTFQFSRAAVIAPAAAATSGASRMVAASVPGTVNFHADAPAHSTSALPMYHHPADRNSAATMVNAGRVLDVEG